MSHAMKKRHFDKIRDDVKFHHDVEGGVAFCWRNSKGSDELTFAVAYKHPNDTYNHALARQIAQGRLLKGKNYYCKLSVNEIQKAMGVEKLTIRNILDYMEFVRSSADELQPAADVKMVGDFSKFL